MSLYQTIFKRRSVRKYKDEKIPKNILSDIEKYLSQITQLQGQKATFRILDCKQMGDNLAPYYIVASCEANNEAYANVGYVLEKLDLYLQDNNIGSLWLGSKMPKNKQPNDAMVMAFGYTNVPYREETDFARLKINKISKVDNSIARVVKLAPSAVNSQPWLLDFEDNKVVINYHGRGILKAALEAKMNKVDIGIATRYVVLALEQEGKKVTNISMHTNRRMFSVSVEYI